MKRLRTDVGPARFALLRFVREESEPLNDTIVTEGMIEERLRPVSCDEFKAFRNDVLEGRPPRIRVAAFGNTATGPAARGSFTGVPYLDVNGTVEVIEHCRRGNTLDQWGDEWEFLFAPNNQITQS